MGQCIQVDNQLTEGVEGGVGGSAYSAMVWSNLLQNVQLFKQNVFLLSEHSYYSCIKKEM